MGRLYRPPIPLAVKCEVAARQIMRHTTTVSFIGVPDKPLHQRLRVLLAILAGLLFCEVADLRLDHDPALGARPRGRLGLGRKTYYTPDANDPDHLFYRPHGPEHAGSHLIKTNVRGDHGQHPDRVLIKKARRLANPGRAKKKARIATLRKTAKPAPKRSWPKRKFQSGRSKP